MPDSTTPEIRYPTPPTQAPTATGAGGHDLQTLAASRRLEYVLRAKDGFTCPTPPQEFIDLVGGGDFHAIGEHFMMIFQDHCDLAADAAVLDLGAGCGRMAIPLSRYLKPGAEYHGIDVVLPMVEWCRDNIGARYANFQFHHAALKNSLYSDTGANAADYRFPFEERKFDFVIATSLFTHLRPDGTRRYIQEIQRVLKPGGKALTTWFLLNRNNLTWGCEHAAGICRVQNPANPDAVVAYEESFVFDAIRGAGLNIDSASYGSWAGTRGLSYQDLLQLSRP